MTVNEQLEKLADEEGEMTIAPDGNDEQSLKAFQGRFAGCVPWLMRE
jgi:hypothetical protein